MVCSGDSSPRESRETPPTSLVQRIDDSTEIYRITLPCRSRPVSASPGAWCVSGARDVLHGGGAG